eukprot:scaffold153299_cov55-Prasinocladus_malaysianus.AAC.1
MAIRLTLRESAALARGGVQVSYRNQEDSALKSTRERILAAKVHQTVPHTMLQSLSELAKVASEIPAMPSSRKGRKKNSRAN